MMDTNTGSITRDEASDYIRVALDQARQGLEEGGLPIGAVLVRDGRIIGRGRNRRVQDNDPLAHAEIVCLRNAGRQVSYEGAVLYSTMMPCRLCATAVLYLGIRKLVVAESETFTGARDLLEGHGVEVVDLDLEECKRFTQEFIRLNPALYAEDTERN